MPLRSLPEAIKAGWLARAGVMKAANLSNVQYGKSKTFKEKWESYTSGALDLIGRGIDSSNNWTFGNALSMQPALQPAIYTLEPTASLVDQVFYIANQRMLVKAIYEIHRVAGSVSAAGMVRKCTPGQTITQGTALQTATFDMTATAQTQLTATLVANNGYLTLEAGDRLALDYSGTLTTLAGVCVQVWLQPLEYPTLDITYCWASNTQLIDTQFFVANDRYVVTAVRWAHSTKSSVASTVVQLTNDTSTNAPGAGTDMLTNTSNTGFTLDSAANTPQVGVLTGTAATNLLLTGNRLSVDYAGTLTALAGVCMTVSLAPIAGRLEIPFYIPSTWAANTDETFFISNGNYKATIASEVHAVAAGGASTMQVVKDTGTDAPGAGTDLLLAAFDENGTAQTVDPDLLAAASYTVDLIAADRLSVDFANAVQSSSGLLVTTSLQVR